MPFTVGLTEKLCVHIYSSACDQRALGGHEGWDLQRGMLTGVCLAAASLSDPTCTAGIGPLGKSLALAKKFGFQPAIEKH